MELNTVFIRLTIGFAALWGTRESRHKWLELDKNLHDSDICSFYERPHSYSLINILHIMFRQSALPIAETVNQQIKASFKMVPILWDRGGLWWNLTPQSPVNICTLSPHTLHQCASEQHMIGKVAPTAFQPCEIEEKAEARRCTKKYQISNFCDETNSNIIMNKKKTKKSTPGLPVHWKMCENAKHQCVSVRLLSVRCADLALIQMTCSS